MARTLGTWPVESAEWLDARRWRIGGSEIAQACGQSPYGTPDDLLAAKLDPQPRTVSRVQERGTMLEPAVLDWVCQRESLMSDMGASAATYVHDRHDWALYNPDGIADPQTVDDSPVLVEIKTTTDRCRERGWGRAGTDSIPAHYACQVQWGMGVLGLDRCVLGVLHGATNGRPDLALSVYRIAFDPELFGFLLAFGARFMERLTIARNGIAA